MTVESDRIISHLRIPLRQIKHFMGQDGGIETKPGQGISDDPDKNKIFMSRCSLRLLRSLVSISLPH